MSTLRKDKVTKFDRKKAQTAKKQEWDIRSSISLY